MSEVLICVTERDIENGRQESERFCPIALAVKRVTGRRFVEVNQTTISARRSDEFSDPFWEVGTPNIACDFVNAFDLYGRSAVDPFSFTISLPDSLGGPQ